MLFSPIKCKSATTIMFGYIEIAGKKTSSSTLFVVEVLSSPNDRIVCLLVCASRIRLQRESSDEPISAWENWSILLQDTNGKVSEPHFFRRGSVAQQRLLTNFEPHFFRRRSLLLLQSLLSRAEKQCSRMYHSPSSLAAYR